ncbi:MICOS complex subunit mic60, partial [Linderina pennispora]
ATSTAGYSARMSAARRFASTTPTTPTGAAKDAAKAAVKDATNSAAKETVSATPKPTTAPKPAASKKKTHKIRNTAILALLAGSAFVGAAAYAQEDVDFDESFEMYVPGARRFMQLTRHHDDSLLMALSDVGFHVYDDVAYTAKFIYGQLFNLYNMLAYNNWTGETADDDESGRKRDVAAPPKIEKPAAPKKENKSTIDDALPSAPLKKIQLAVEIPPLVTDNSAVAELSKTLSAVVAAFNKKGLSPENMQQLKALSDSLIALDLHLKTLKDEERKVVEAALAEERKKFESTLTEFQQAARIALASREAQLIESQEAELSAAAKASDERLIAELTSQRDLLERRFNRFVRARVDEERGGRLAHLDRVEAQLRELAQTAQQSGGLLRQSQAVARLSVAIASLKSAVIEGKKQTPFASELSALASAATTDFPATQAAVAAIPRELAEQGVPSQVELEDRFEAVRKEIRSVSLVPENGNFGSQVLSATLSKVMFEKEGLVEGDDVEAVLARTSFYLKEHNLDMAARELNQLRGWPKKLAEDWITTARRRLEVEQALRVAESEEFLAKFSLV